MKIIVDDSSRASSVWSSLGEHCKEGFSKGCRSEESKNAGKMASYRKLFIKKMMRKSRENKYDAKTSDRFTSSDYEQE